MNPLGSIGKGLLLGIGAAAPIGPVNVEIARRTLGSSFAHGALLGMGAVTIDCLYASLTSLGVSAVALPASVRTAMSIGAVALLCWLAYLSLRGGIRAARGAGSGELSVGDGAAATVGRRSAKSAAACYVTGLAMTLVNPMTLAFWFTTVVGVARQITDRPGRDLPMICLGVFLGTGGWVMFFAGTLAIAGRQQRWWWVPAADIMGGLILIFFAGWTAWRSARGFL